MKLIPTCDISLKTWLTEKEALVYIGLGRNYLYMQRAAARISFRRVGGRIIYKREDLDNHILKYGEFFREFETHSNRQ